MLFKDVFHTNNCYDHVMTGLLVLQEMINVVFSENKETGYNSRSLFNEFRSSLDRREQLNSEHEKRPQVDTSNLKRACQTFETCEMW